VDSTDDFATTQDVVSRVITTNSASCVATGVGIGYWGSSVDIQSPLSELVARGGFDGNAVTLLFWGNTDNTNEFRCEPQDGGTANLPIIYIDYTAAAGGVAPTSTIYGPLVGPLGGPV
jgi:hypothetical protein